MCHPRVYRQLPHQAILLNELAHAQRYVQAQILFHQARRPDGAGVMPPCPASMTMRPIFKPRARDKDCWPSRGVSGMEAGPFLPPGRAPISGCEPILFLGKPGAQWRWGATLWPAPATGKDADCTTRSVGAGLSIADGITADLDAMFLLALVESISRWAGAYANRTGP